MTCYHLIYYRNIFLGTHTINRRTIAERTKTDNHFTVRPITSNLWIPILRALHKSANYILLYAVVLWPRDLLFSFLFCLSAAAAAKRICIADNYYIVHIVCTFIGLCLNYGDSPLHCSNIELIVIRLRHYAITDDVIANGRRPMLFEPAVVMVTV